MRPEDCKGTSDRAASESEWDDGRAQAWHAVFEEMLRRNPRVSNHANTGIKCALAELRRLYDIEARFALLSLRNGDLPSSVSTTKEQP